MKVTLSGRLDPPQSGPKTAKAADWAGMVGSWLTTELGMFRGEATLLPTIAHSSYHIVWAPID